MSAANSGDILAQVKDDDTLRRSLRHEAGDRLVFAAALVLIYNSKMDHLIYQTSDKPRG